MEFLWWDSTFTYVRFERDIHPAIKSTSPPETMRRMIFIQEAETKKEQGGVKYTHILDLSLRPDNN